MINKNQEIFITSLIKTFEGFKNTNDINSPTHTSDIDEEMFKLETVLDVDLHGMHHDVKNSVRDLLNVIRIL